jgi:signal transduction histidine kinase
MKRGRMSFAVLPESLRRLRLRLTAWYAGTFFAILALLGAGMFAEVTHLFDRELDASLRVAASELASAVQARARREADRGNDIAEEVEDLRVPDRSLYLTDSLGRPLTRERSEEWIERVAHGAALRGTADTSNRLARPVARAHAQSFRLDDGRLLVAVASASEVELQHRYATLIAAFGAAALASVVLVAAGGSLLARQSTAPVEQAIVHMRRFMADAAHELRTPLTVIRGRAEIAIQRSRESTEYVAALNGIEREAERLGRIVEDLLMLARADAGERPIERQRVFLDDVTLDAAEAARTIADRKSVRLEVDSFEEAPVTADPALLRQLVMILLDNAVKYTEPHGVVRVGVQGNAFAATLSVVDTGIGIPPDQLPHVFERFYRGDPSRTRARLGDAGASEGAGLGLAIAKWIAEEHGGAIRIESQAGQGTSVFVQFPRAAPVDHA